MFPFFVRIIPYFTLHVHRKVKKKSPIKKLATLIISKENVKSEA